jgi:hypothetical protein
MRRVATAQLQQKCTLKARPIFVELAAESAESPEVALCGQGSPGASIGISPVQRGPKTVTGKFQRHVLRNDN